VGLGQGFDRSEARLLGVYDHFYADSVFGGEADGNPDTHYVVLAYQLILAAPSGDGDSCAWPSWRRAGAAGWKCWRSAT